MELVPGQKIVFYDAEIPAEKVEKTAPVKVSLTYVSAEMKGISRAGDSGNFYYLDHKGNELDDPETLKRIKSLVIPPAWQEVWICSRADGHLQATGIDQKGRKQYRYHAGWNKLRSQRKFMHLLEFGKKLPLIRKKIQQDLQKQGFPEEKIIALVISIMQKTLIRVGNEVYADLYQSYGLTTLRNRHVNISGEEISFHFKGKKGIVHDIRLKNPRLSGLLKKVKDLPGQELFQYMNAEGERRSVDSGRVNAYLHEACGEEFSAKDIRTWSGTAYMLQLLASSPELESEAACKKQVIELLDKVAGHLGNTRTVCRKYYVHPGLISAYEAKQLGAYLNAVNLADEEAVADSGLSLTEQTLLGFLSDLAREKTVTG